MGTPNQQNDANTRHQTARRRFLAVTAAGTAGACLAAIPAAGKSVMASASPPSADAELVALGKQFRVDLKDFVDDFVSVLDANGSIVWPATTRMFDKQRALRVQSDAIRAVKATTYAGLAVKAEVLLYDALPSIMESVSGRPFPVQRFRAFIDEIDRLAEGDQV